MANKTDSPRLFLIDGSGYIFRAYHALPPLTRPSDGLPVGAVSGFCNMLWKFMEDMKGAEAPTHLAVIFDATEVTFRNELYPQYKAHRPPAPEDLVPQFPLIRDAVRAFNVPCIEMAGFEADDLIATYARQAMGSGANVKIVSSDKDLMQLIVDGVIELYDPMKQKPLGPEAVLEKFGVTPDKVIDVQALIGDSVDNVPGAPGIGPKTAAELIGMFGSLDAILERAAEIKQPKRRAAIEDNAAQIRLSRLLVTLKDDVAVAESWEGFALREPDPAMLLEFLDKMEFRTLSRRVREQAAREGKAEAYVAVAAEPAAEAPFEREKFELIATTEALKSWVERAFARGIVAIGAAGTSADAQQARLVGVSLALGPNETAYAPLGHVTGPGEGAPVGDLFAPSAPTLCEGQIDAAEALALLKPLLEDESVLKVGHDIKFDISLMARNGVALGPIDDVMLMSFALAGGKAGVGHSVEELSVQHLGHKPLAFAEVAGKGKAQLSFDCVAVEAGARYAAERADVALRLWRRLKPDLAREALLAVYETLERPLPAVLSAMEREGVKVDPKKLNALSADFEKRMAVLEAEAKRVAGREFNVGSPKQLGEILFDEMKLPGGSKTKTGAWSTDSSVLEEVAAQGHELPRVVLDWRQLAKLRSTYTEALQQAINPATKRVHTSFMLAAASTGRLASTEPNLQNIPVRTEEGRAIREAFIAEKGNVLLSADYSQIELRLLAHVADIAQLKQAFADNIDIHALTASEMFGVPVKGMDPMVRRQAKAINFGIIYGISAFGLARNLGIERSEADAYIKKYFERFPGIRAYMEEMKTFARANGFVRTIFGRRIWVGAITSRNQAERGFAERQSINAPLQGAAADIIRRAMIHLPEALAASGLAARMLLQVHDELVFEVTEKDAPALGALVKDVMEKAPEPAAQLTVPLAVEANWAKTWAGAH
jgi:DNA polymerase I